MKKNIFICLICFMLFMISVSYLVFDRSILVSNMDDNVVLDNVSNVEVRAFFFSYLEFEKYIMNEDDKGAKENIDKVINNMIKDKFNLLILHVRPFSDSIYPSLIFPRSKYIGNVSFDVLKYFINKCHDNNIKIHAWINPYRISSNKNFVIDENHPAHSFIGTSNIGVLDNGVYYNPSSLAVTSLIISGIEEIINNYDVDGICFDDYFYPGGDIDKESYILYKSSGGSLGLSDYRLSSITNMISMVYSSIKRLDSSIVFGISPQGNIENNYSSVFLDVKTILSSSGYVDYIMPQIYFGFDNSSRPYISTIKEWNDLIKVSSIDLIPALALYKSGEEDKWAGSGKKEWIKNTDILKRQILYAREMSRYTGFSIFIYNNFYSSNINSNMVEEVKNIRSILK